jgi:hypothetical protein
VRLGRLRRARWAAWLATVAVILNTLVPVHLAFDLAESFDTAHQHEADAPGRGLEWRALVLLTGHDADDRKPVHHGKAHEITCPVCTALGSLGGIAPVAGPVLSVPATIAVSNAFAAVDDAPATATTGAYRSRAPPLA